MSLQFPSFSTEEQTERVKKYASDTYYPYSYSLALVNAAAAYPFSDSVNTPGAIGTIKYNTIAFKADNNMSISAIGINFALSSVFAFGTIIQSYYFYKITTNPTLNFYTNPSPGAAIAQPTPPGDTGQDIYMWSAAIAPTGQTLTAGQSAPAYQNFNYLERYTPYNINFKFNQTLYIHMGVDTTTASSNLGFWNISTIFYTLPTGSKT